MLELALANLKPAPRSRLLDWCRANVQTGEGRPYDHSAYPHLGAPGGPMDAFDCSQYLSIWLQWASRLGKSFFGQCATMKTADCDPCPMMFASSDQKLAVEVTARTYRMLAKCPALRDQLRPEHRRKQDLVDLDACRMFVAWARSVSTLADKAVRVGHANEIDKWEHASTAKEADPLKLFSDRFKEFPRHKKIFESTPAMKHSSRIERGRLGSTNCSYWVPCPHCRRYQTLKMDRIAWDKLPGEKSDKDLARRTARYNCLHCEAAIRDEHRGPMMRAGVWVPEGCGVNDEAAAEVASQTDRQPFAGWSLADWIEGTPLRDGRDAGYQLSSLYALSLTWGDIAAEWIDCQRNPQNLRNFINQWLAETWETRGVSMTWEKLGERMIGQSKRGVVPLECSVLTLGVDKQAEHCVYVLAAWAPGRKMHVIDYGERDTLDELYQQVIDRTYPHEDGGKPVPISLGLIDSGYHPRDIYEFCRQCAKRNKPVWPCKGSNQSLNAPYREARLGKDTLAPNAPIVHVDTLTSQDWLNHTLSLSPKDSEVAPSLFSDSMGAHEDFLQQLLNEACVQKLTPSNQTKEVWERIDENTPNDYRDCVRYAFVAMLRYLRGGQIRERVKQPVERREGRTGPPPKVQFLERPGGWLNK